MRDRFSYSVKDLLSSIERFKKTEEYVHEALARGKRHLVIDENIETLADFLKQKNYTVIKAYGSDDQIKNRLLQGAVFITNNERDFIDRMDRMFYHYGLVIVPQIDEQILADYVEKCLMQAEFKDDLLQVWKIYNDGQFEKVD